MPIKEHGQPGAHMPFLGHLEELRKRITRMFAILVLAFFICFYFADSLYRFLSIPIRRAVSEAERQEVPVNSDGTRVVSSVVDLKMGDSGRYAFESPVKVGSAVIPAGAAVLARVDLDPRASWAFFRLSLLLRIRESF
jgi:hypothetical protein